MLWVRLSSMGGKRLIDFDHEVETFLIDDSLFVLLNELVQFYNLFDYSSILWLVEFEKLIVINCQEKELEIPCAKIGKN